MAYVGVPGFVAVAVPIGTQAQNLLTLMTAIVPALSQVNQNCTALALQADLVNGSNVVYVGDSQVSLTRYGYALFAHDQVPYQSPININVPLNQIWMIASTSGCQVNCQVWFS